MLETVAVKAARRITGERIILHGKFAYKRISVMHGHVGVCGVGENRIPEQRPNSTGSSADSFDALLHKSVCISSMAKPKVRTMFESFNPTAIERQRQRSLLVQLTECGVYTRRSTKRPTKHGDVPILQPAQEYSM